MLHANNVLARESEKMSSVMKVAGRAFAGAVVSLAMVPLAQAAKVAVNDEIPLTIQSPGFSYVTSNPGEASALSVTTDGYLFCANVGDSAGNVVTFAPGHARWTLPEAFLKSVTYSGGELQINQSPTGASLVEPLACHARGAQGEIATPFSHFGNGIFLNGYEGLEETQYASMVNWSPVDGFDWSQPDWTQVPTDPCNFSMTSADSPHVDETTLCAAATGVRPGGSEFGTRAPTMWTATAGSNFIYLARIDARLGPQEVPPNSQFNGLLAPEQIEELPSNVDTQIRDGYDSQYLTDTVTYCFLSELPATLNASVCNGAAFVQTKDGVIEENVSLSLSFPAAPATSF
jgi:hypothetical protein